MFVNLKKKNHFMIFLGCIAIVFFHGILSTAHYSMGLRDFYMGLVAGIFASIGLLVWYFFNSVKKIGFSTLTWLLLAFLIVLQPLINGTIYSDALMFPLGTLLLATLISVAGVNIPRDKQNWVIKSGAYVFLIGGALTVCTQLVQLFMSNHTLGFISPVADRLYANLSQPNQAGFVIVLAITSSIYLFFLNYYKNKKLTILFLLCSLFLAMGISFSLSRVALVMLAFASIGTLFYPWQNHKIRLFSTFICITTVTIGYQIGTVLMGAFFAGYTGTSGVDRLLQGDTNLRQILLERAWSAFVSDPIFGVGYGNYLSFGLENREKWAWFENAHHAHNVIAQLGAELGLIGLVSVLGVVFVLVTQLILFITRKISSEHFFVCLLLLSFVLYSFTEYPLWYTRFLFPFVLLIALLDKGFGFKNFALNKALAVLSIVIGMLSVLYVGVYNYYLHRYEIVMYLNVDDQQKVDAYKSLPTVFGFTKFKEEMLHMVIDEEATNPKALLEVGDRLIKGTGSIDVMRVQARLFIKTGQTEEADRLHKILCLYEHQTVGHCDYVLTKILELDTNDEMGYASRLNNWYLERYNKQ